MPTLLPRESMDATSVVRASIQRPSPSDHRVGFSNLVYEATSRFTCVSACDLAVWKLTTPCYHDAASSCYRGVRTTPQTGLQPARFTAVTANGQSMNKVLKLGIAPVPMQHVPVRRRLRLEHANASKMNLTFGSPLCPPWHGSSQMRTWCCSRSFERVTQTPWMP